MDYLWTPWRYQYIAQAIPGKQPECIFCDAAARSDDEVTQIVHRGTSCFVILNLYPYTSGHVMIVPYAHVAELNCCERGTLDEMMQLAQRVETVLRANYKPDGMNLGMNLGRAAGAGVDWRYRPVAPRRIGFYRRARKLGMVGLAEPAGHFSYAAHHRLDDGNLRAAGAGIGTAQECGLDQRIGSGLGSGDWNIPRHA